MITERLIAICGEAYVEVGDAVSDDWCHDEALGVEPGPTAGRGTSRPPPTKWPPSSGPPAERALPVTARGSGTGLSGAAVPVEGGVVVAFDRMATDPRDRYGQPGGGGRARGHPGRARRRAPPYGLVYPVFPGEQSASLGGNVATNAGGMRAVKYGVTRHHVLGLEAVLGPARSSPPAGSS